MTAPAIFIRTLNGIIGDMTAELTTARQYLADIEKHLGKLVDRQDVIESKRLATLARLKIEMTLRLLNGDG